MLCMLSTKESEVRSKIKLKSGVVVGGCDGGMQKKAFVAMEIELLPLFSRECKI